LGGVRFGGSRSGGGERVGVRGIWKVGKGAKRRREGGTFRGGEENNHSKPNSKIGIVPVRSASSTSVPYRPYSVKGFTVPSMCRPTDWGGFTITWRYTKVHDSR